jgi:hypothetical protein
MTEDRCCCVSPNILKKTTEEYFMNTLSHSGLKQINWSTIVLLTLGFWLSASLVLDLVIVPGLLASGMMAASGFASVGYLIFGIFNRIELVCAALILCSFLVFRHYHNLNPQQERWSTILAGALFAIAIVYTYILTPQMSGMGLQLNQFDVNYGMSDAMIQMHGSYWVLEMIKLISGATLLRWCYLNRSVDHV